MKYKRRINLMLNLMLAQRKIVVFGGGGGGGGGRDGVIALWRAILLFIMQIDILYIISDN